MSVEFGSEKEARSEERVSFFNYLTQQKKRAKYFRELYRGVVKGEEHSFRWYDLFLGGNHACAGKVLSVRKGGVLIRVANPGWVSTQRNSFDPELDDSLRSEFDLPAKAHRKSEGMYLRKTVFIRFKQMLEDGEVILEPF